MSDILRPQLGGGGGLLREEFEIHKTDRMKIVAVFWIVPSSEPGRKHVNLRIEQYKKNPRDPGFPLKPTSSINFDEVDMDKLLSSVKAQTLLKDSSPSDRVVVLRGGHSDELLPLSDRDVSSLKLLLTSLTDENVRKLAKTVDARIVEKIDSAVRYVQMEESLQKLQALVERDTPEAAFQEWFNHNTWIFGKQYVSRVPRSTIGLESKADLIYVSVDGFADLLELKKSVLSSTLLLHDPSHKSFYPSSDLSKALAQAMHYIQVIEDHRLQLEKLSNIPVLRPTVTIIMGRSHNWNDPTRQHLRILNSSLVNIKVLTYDHLLAMGQSLLSLYSPVDDEIGF
jgi:hypothetical protein